MTFEVSAPYISGFLLVGYWCLRLSPYGVSKGDKIALVLIALLFLIIPSIAFLFPNITIEKLFFALSFLFFIAFTVGLAPNISFQNIQKWAIVGLLLELVISLSITIYFQLPPR